MLHRLEWPGDTGQAQQEVSIQRMHCALLVIDVQHGLFGGVPGNMGPPMEAAAVVQRINHLMATALARCGTQRLVVGGCASKFCVDTTARRALELVKFFARRHT